MADPICRWRNSSVKQLMEFNSLLPLYKVEKSQGRAYVERLWRIIGGEDFFTTPYQLAVQMGTYYEDETSFYPRFNKLLSIEEAASYMLNWGRNYYSPNPYTKSIKNVRPVVINKFLVNFAQKEQNPTFTNALSAMFGDNIVGNTDILKNMLNTFSEINVDNDIVTVKEEAVGKFYNDNEIFPSVDVNDKQAFFEHLGKIELEKITSFPLQQIFYGAPGTGKSHGIKEKEGDFSKVIRTTFHPDSDYSTFVGAYKPTMASKERIYSADELIGKLTTIKESGISYPCHKFSAQYWESLKDLSAAEIKRIITACGFTDTMTVEVGKGISIGQELASKSDDKKITYTFVKQAFLKAYIEAWNRHDKGENVLLVIEEINRGNCAQIFGDLFQLLDRNDEGFSDYPIQADEDLRKVLADEFINLDNIPENVKSGEELLLPNNLYIWATMNTSDQSLFPIDSAFKRRWDWKYVPINTAKESWTIKVNGKEYSWTSFLDIINEKIYAKTQSEDKQLGFYFCKAEGNVVSAERFVSKVLFYVYNDVFKDYGFDDSFFNSDNGKLTFQGYYQTDGEINEEMVAIFLDNLEKEGIRKNVAEDK